MTTDTNRHWLLAAGRIALALLLLAVIIRLAAGDLATIGDSLAQAAPWPIVGVALIFLLTRLTDALYMLLLYKPGAPSLNLRGAIRLVVIQGVAALAIPRFGNVAGAAYLKTVHGLGLLRFSGIHLAASLLNGATIALIGLVFLAVVAMNNAPEGSGIVAIILIIALLAFILSLALGNRFPVFGSGRLHEAVTEARAGFASLHAQQPRLGGIFALQAWSMLARSARIGLCVMAIDGVWPRTDGLLVAGSLADLATIIALTPSGLGLREAAATASATIAGINAEVMLSAVLLDRVVGVAGTLVLGLPLAIASKHDTQKAS